MEMAYVLLATACLFVSVMCYFYVKSDRMDMVSSGWGVVFGSFFGSLSFVWFVYFVVKLIKII